MIKNLKQYMAKSCNLGFKPLDTKKFQEYVLNI